MPDMHEAATGTTAKGLSGIPVDSGGGPTVDPTKNVLDLVFAAVQRLNDVHNLAQRRSDDLDAAETRRVNERFTQEQKRVDELRSANDRRQDCLRDVWSAHHTAIAALRADYTERLATAESKRVDANRSGDVNNVAIANERANIQATALQTAVQATAEAARTAASQQQLQIEGRMTQIGSQLGERIAALEKSVAEGHGKSAVADPALAEALTDLKQAIKYQDRGEGQVEGVKTSAHVVDRIIMLVVAALGAFGVALHFVGK